MLTKQDFSEIQKIVQQETSVSIEKAVAPIKKDIKRMKTDISEISAILRR
jgi:hypothetical protein